MNKVTDWIDHFLAADPPRSKSLVMTIFGDAVAPHGGTIWLGSLIELAAPFGVSDRLVRTSVFRLAQEGWLAASRDGRRSAYAIRPDALARFEHANHRIYLPLDAHWDGAWTLLISGAADIDPKQRAQIRKELEWEGYSMIAPGIFGHPASNAQILEDILARTGLRGKLVVCSASELPGVSTRPLRELVGEGWDLGPVMQAYAHFIDAFAPLAGLMEQGAALTPQEAFVVRTLLIHAYRRVQLHDPMLPVELLPEPWPGTRAYAMAQAIYRYTYGRAEEHIVAVMQREAPRTPPAQRAFYARFGGLAPAGA